MVILSSTYISLCYLLWYSGLVHAKEVHDKEEVMRHADKSSLEFSIVLIQSLADTKTSWADAIYYMGLS